MFMWLIFLNFHLILDENTNAFSNSLFYFCCCFSPSMASQSSERDPGSSPEYVKDGIKQGKEQKQLYRTGTHVSSVTKEQAIYVKYALKELQQKAVNASMLLVLTSTNHARGGNERKHWICWKTHLSTQRPASW